MPYVNASAITAVERDDRTMQLRITFRKSGTFIFYGVPKEVYEAFLRARSKGLFFSERIRKHYPSSH